MSLKREKFNQSVKYGGMSSDTVQLNPPSFPRTGGAHCRHGPAADHNWPYAVAVTPDTFKPLAPALTGRSASSCSAWA